MLSIAAPRDGQTVAADTVFPVCDALWIPTAGNIQVQFESGSIVTFYNFVGGDYLPGKFIKIVSAGSTCAGPFIAVNI